MQLSEKPMVFGPSFSEFIDSERGAYLNLLKSFLNACLFNFVFSKGSLACSK